MNSESDVLKMSDKWFACHVGETYSFSHRELWKFDMPVSNSRLHAIRPL